MNEALLLPKLRHIRWIGWTEVAGRDLFDKPMAHGLPRLGVGEDTPQRYSFVTPLLLAEEGRSFAELEAIALANLRRRPAEWTVAEHKRRGLFGKKPLRLQHIDEFACERLLDPEFMAEAHRLLNHEILAASVPARGLLTVWPGIAEPDEIGRMLMAAERMFEGVPENMEPVSPVVLTIQKGRPTGVILGTPVRTEDLTPSVGFPWPLREVPPPILPAL